MANKSFDRVKIAAGKRRAEHFANGGTASGWAMGVGAGCHGRNKSKAGRNKSACRKQVRV
jgi:hypothetical protein